jgi:aminopeptidase N
VADFEVKIQLSDSNPDLVIAASAPTEMANDVYRYQFKGARNFSWSVSDQYILSTTTVDSVVVLAYYFPVNTVAGEAVLQTTAEALALYNDLFGPYSRKTLTVVEADFLDGMEYDGLYFLSKGFYNLYSGGPTDYLTAIAAHETSHQWWYSAIGNDQALEPWLDEALATYSERLFYENLHPEGLDWWWTYRIYYYEPQGWVDGSIYNPEGYRAYRDAVYLNGALFLEDLRNLMGDEPFFEFLYAYSQEYFRRIASGDDFFALLEDYSQTDITPLLDKYFRMR